MIKRVSFFLLINLFIVSITTVSVYYINPYGVKTDSVRPRLFGIDIYRIPSKSMQPLLFPGDYISVSNTAYLDVAPKRKEIIVFFKPELKEDKSSIEVRIPFIKRVIALAGETVKIKDGNLFVNKELVEESYVSSKNNKTSYSLNMNSITVPEDHVFVLGDNRDNSSDSRIFGPIVLNDILAKGSNILYGINDRSGKEIE